MKNFAICLFALSLWIMPANAKTFVFSMDLSNPDGPVLVNGSPTSIPNGISLKLFVHLPASDTWAPSDFGLFVAARTLLTIPDLNVFSESFDNAFGYFEDDDVQRGGLSNLFPDGGIQWSLGTPGNSQVGNPNEIDLLPNPPSGSITAGWNNTRFSLLDGRVVETTSPVLFQDAAISAAVVPLPASLPLLLAGAGSLALVRRNRRA